MCLMKVSMLFQLPLRFFPPFCAVQNLLIEYQIFSPRIFSPWIFSPRTNQSYTFLILVEIPKDTNFLIELVNFQYLLVAGILIADYTTRGLFNVIFVFVFDQTRLQARFQTGISGALQLKLTRKPTMLHLHLYKTNLYSGYL